MARASFQEALAVLWRSVYVRLAALLLLSGLGVALVLQTRGVWLTFALALLVAYLLQPLMNVCERRLRARWLGLLLVLAGLFLLLGFVSLLLAGLVTQVGEFSRELPGLIEQVVSASSGVPAGIQNLALPQALVDIVARAYRSLGAVLARLSGSLGGSLEQFVTEGGLVDGVSVFVRDAVRFVAFLALTLYLLMDLPRVGRSLLLAVPRPYEPLARALTEKLEHSVGGYFRGQLVVASAVGLSVGLGLHALSVPLAPSLGFVAGAFNLVPYLGVIVSIVPSLLLASGVSWTAVVGVLVLFTVVNQLEVHVLSPLVLGRTTKLHPVTIILAVLLGSFSFGLWGAVFAVPATAFLKLLYTDFYLQSRFYREG